jgi:hypothetical protein
VHAAAPTPKNPAAMNGLKQITGIPRGGDCFLDSYC